MMKSWADHCSSDEDTDDNYSVESAESEDKNMEEVPQSLDEAFEEKAQIESTPPERTYDYPTRPPFTAFVGNLSFHIQEASQLQQALADVVFERLGERVNVLGGRISFDRNSQKHRGFGYVELETLEELKTVMKLNDDDQAMLAGRKIQVDTANHSPHRQNNNNNNNNFNRGGRGRNNDRGSFERKPHEKIDGSKFRGGKFNNQNFNRNNNNNNNNNKNNNSSNNDSKPADAGPPRQRPSLKLAPRSKPIEDRSSGSSDIFGGAKARDEQAWERGRQQQGGEKKILKKPDAEKKGDNAKPNDKGGRGGRGGRGGKDRGGKGGRGGDHKKKRNSQTEKKKPPAEEKAPPAPKPAAKPAEEPPKPKEKGPKNKFALLMDDSDSD